MKNEDGEKQEREEKKDKGKYEMEESERQI
jgi:hypothetical protein